MQDPSPAGWEEFNRQYFERLSSGGAENRRGTARGKDRTSGEEVEDGR